MKPKGEIYFNQISSSNPKSFLDRVRKTIDSDVRHYNLPYQTDHATSWINKLAKLQQKSRPKEESSANNISIEVPPVKKSTTANVQVKVADPAEQGEIEAKEAIAKSKVMAIANFDSAIRGSAKVIYTLKTHKLPIDLNPTTIIIDCNKIIIKNEDFLGNESSHSFNVQDLTDVILQTSFISASLELVDRNFNENSITIKDLKIDEAKKARRILQGLMIASAKNISISGFPAEELVSRLEQLGMSAV